MLIFNMTSNSVKQKSKQVVASVAKKLKMQW